MKSVLIQVSDDLVVGMKEKCGEQLNERLSVYLGDALGDLVGCDALTSDVGKSVVLDGDITSIAQILIDAAKIVYGEAEYEYYAIPVYWRRDGHTRPITGLGEFKITCEEYEKNKSKGKKDATDAFMGKLKRTYTSYERRIVKDGWRQQLIEYFTNLEE